MATVYEIPIVAGSNQKLSVTLAGVEYQLTLTYRDANEAGWTLAIADSEGNVILAGLPLVTGQDLLEQYVHLGFGGKLFVMTDGDEYAVPTWDNLGSTAHLYWVET